MWKDNTNFILKKYKIRKSERKFSKYSHTSGSKKKIKISTRIESLQICSLNVSL